MRKGFTIVELLIVIVIIAILATLTIVVFNGIQNRAKVSSVNAALGQAKKKLELYKVEYGTYPLTNNLASAGVADGDTTFQYTSDGTTYCITGTNSNVSYKMTDISTPSSGACTGHTDGGAAPITNLAINPAATGYTTTQSQFGWRSDRYTASGTYSVVSNASDGPTPDLKTYVRYTFTQVVSTSRGFHNVGNPEGTAGTTGGSVTAGTTYTFSVYFRSSNGDGTANIGVRFTDGNGNWIGSTVSGTAASLSSGWVRLSVTATAPSGATKAHLYEKQVSGGNHTIGDTLDGTGLMITEGSTVYNYADGASTGWSWTGSANSSTSTGPPK